jgi:hypothetical protein
MEDVLDLTAEDTQVDEPLLGEQPAEGEQPEAQADETGPVELFNGGKLSEPIKSAITKLKGEYPRVANQLTQALFRVSELDRSFPGGLTEVKDTLSKIEEYGGLSGIEDKMAGVQEMNNLAEAFMKGDAAFVDDLAVSSPESFAAFAPQVFARYAQDNPDGYTSYIGRVVYADLQRQDVPLLMARLADVLGDATKAQPYFEQLNAYLGNFRTLAEMPHTAPKPVAKTSTSDSKIAEENARLKNEQTETARKGTQTQLANTEYTKNLAGRQPDTEQKAQIKALFDSKSKDLANSLFPGWVEKAGRYLKTGDRAGYLRLMKSIDVKVIPQAVAYAVSRTMGKGRGFTGKIQNQQQNGKAPVDKGQPAPAAAGFTLVANEPNSYQIDYDRTNKQMLQQNRAVMKDGRKITWK